MNDILK